MGFIGFIIILWLVYIAIKGYNKAKTRKYNAVIVRAKRSLSETKDICYPTWFNNNNKRHQFIDVVRTLSLKQGVPAPYLDKMFKSEEFFRVVIMKFTAILEKNKLGFTSQMVGTSDLIRDMWDEGMELPPSQSTLNKINQFLDTKIFNSVDASAVATHLYLGAHFLHAIEIYSNPRAVSFEKKYSHTMSNEVKIYFDKIDVTNGRKHMETYHPNCRIDMAEIDRFISSCCDKTSADELLVLKLLSAVKIIEDWKLR